ncbi:MAG: efflux RND transporter periplasmic adaptor subunit [Lewinellaceae bacterium]|nr:efflux RND transporter periplasmic adaptor subunit [Lewinellaceae bacterium]
MDLVKKENQPVTHPSDSSHTPEMHGHASSAEAGVSAIGDLDMLLKPTYEYVLSTVKTLHPEQRTMPLRLDAPGYLAYDPRLLNVVSARFGGRIERLYARYPYQPVRKGQRILDIYSRNCHGTTGTDFLLENDPANTILLENARKRLSLLGLTGEQIRQVETERKPLLSLPVFSLYSGLIFDNSVSLNNTASAAPGMNENMNNTAAPAQTVPASAGPGELSLKEGMYVQAGQRLFGLQSLATVWAMLEFYPSDVSMLNTGQAVEIHVEPFERPFKSKIDYIEPLYSSGGKNLRARVYLPNPGGQLKPGACSGYRASGQSDSTLDSGNRQSRSG